VTVDGSIAAASFERMTTNIKSADDKAIWLELAGQREKVAASYWRGDHTHFYPNDAAMELSNAVQQYLALGLMPQAPLIGPATNVVAMGSCFAAHIRDYLAGLSYRILSGGGETYIAKFSDGLVNTFALRQQFEWGWEGREPTTALWHGYDRKTLGYSDKVRVATRAMLDAADVFIITLGLSEVWFDEPTGEVFWRAVPRQYFDPSRHKFRVARQGENVANLKRIVELVRKHKPTADVVFTLSPVPLSATFRPISCLAADSVSKANLRSAVDEVMTDSADEKLHYFPSYEVVTKAFEHPFMEERRHAHKHVIDFNMAMFERYYCSTGMTDEDLANRFHEARALDRRVIDEGHFSVERIHVRHHAPAKPAAGVSTGLD